MFGSIAACFQHPGPCFKGSAGVLLQRQLSACAQGSQRPFPVLGGRGVLRALLHDGDTALTLPGLSSAQRLLPAARREVQALRHGTEMAAL